MEFGARLKEIITSLNISQKELSEQTGLTLRTIQRIENNEVKPSLYLLKVIGEALKTDVSGTVIFFRLVGGGVCFFMPGAVVCFCLICGVTLRVTGTAGFLYIFPLYVAL